MKTSSVTPAGFVPSYLDEGFLSHVGPLYMQPLIPGRQLFVLALRAGPQHANRYGVVHGGLLATLADTAIGANLARTAPAPAVDTTLTLNLSLDYIASAQIGDWIEAHVHFAKERGRVRFGRCEIRTGDKLLVHGTASFYAPPGA